MSEQVLASIGVAVVIVAAAVVLWAMIWAVCWSVAWVWNWWRWWPRSSERRIPAGIDADCWYDTHEDCPGCECACHADLPLLPPERTWEQMTSHQLPAVHIGEDMSWWAPPHRERRAPWWEAEHRAAYESLDLEYPSGLLARVREAGQ